MGMHSGKIPPAKALLYNYTPLVTKSTLHKLVYTAAYKAPPSAARRGAPSAGWLMTPRLKSAFLGARRASRRIPDGMFPSRSAAFAGHSQQRWNTADDLLSGLPVALQPLCSRAMR